MIIEYDHRIPLFKGGSNDITNYQIISKLANKEKNKICNGCMVDDCENCALAFPEKTLIILPNKQDLRTFREEFVFKEKFNKMDKWIE